jgi:hypothetical protein
MEEKMNRRELRRIKDQENKVKVIEEFTKRINTVYDNSNAITIPSVAVMKEQEQSFVNYYISKHPNCLKYSVSMYKKDYPFNMYYSKEYYKEDLPEQYVSQFEELEVYFK